jgi:transcriptional regulator with XRE-family HTH domain
VASERLARSDHHNDRLVHSSAPVTLLLHPVDTMHNMPSPEAVAAAVARNTRRLRTARGWSLDQFATRSGVSKGMLVHLEQARTNPSLGTLCKVAETLGVSLARLVELHEAPAVRVVAPDEVVRLWHSEAGSFGDLLVGSDERDHLELWHWTLEPDDGHGADAHAAGTREMVHVMSGALTVEVDGDPHVVPAGGAALFHADRPHAYRNAGSTAVSLVMVVVQPDADLDEWTAGLGDSSDGAPDGDGASDGDGA